MKHMSGKNTNRNTFLFSLILIGIISRFIPHPPNFTAVAAVGLFAGAQLGNKRLAILVPIIILLLSDLLIGFHSSMMAVYVAMAAVVGIGIWVGQNSSAVKIGLGAIGASVSFYLITNAAVWLSSGMYPMDLSGLIASYVAGIPFFWNSLAADLSYTTLLFGIHYIVVNRFPQLAK
jgi:hypothetical protein